MSVQLQDFVRKQFPVQAVRVTPMNIEELAELCGGKIMHDGEKENNFSRDYIKVRVAFPLNEEQTKARIGDWLVKQGRTFKVYKDRSFRNTFESKDGTPIPGGNQRNKGNNGPSPANMPKKKVEGARPSNVIVDEQAEFAAAQQAKEESENKVAEAVEQTPAPDVSPEQLKEWQDRDAAQQKEAGIRNLEGARIHSANLVEGPPDPSKGVFPVEIGTPEQQDALIEQKIEEGKLPLQSPAETSDAVAAEKAELVEELNRDANDDPILTGEGTDPENSPEGDSEESSEEKKAITLDELNDQAGDPRSAEDIYREGREGNPA